MANNHSETEKRLWKAADEFRANSELKSSEYAVPVLGHQSFDFVNNVDAVMEKPSNALWPRWFIDFTDYPESVAFGNPGNNSTASIWSTPDVELEPRFFLVQVLFRTPMMRTAVAIPEPAGIDCPCCNCADYNDDGMVNLADFTVYRDSLGTSVPAYTSSDGSGNGVVDGADYELWRSQFGDVVAGSSVRAASIAEVPEATTWLLCVLATAPWLLVGRLTDVVYT